MQSQKPVHFDMRKSAHHGGTHSNSQQYMSEHPFLAEQLLPSLRNPCLTRYDVQIYIDLHIELYRIL